MAPRSRRTIPLASSLIAAGNAVEIGEDSRLLDLNDAVTHGRDGFLAFAVSGDSMVEQIRPGYLIFVDSWIEAKNGDIIAAMVDGLVCVKIFKYSSNGLYLVSANPDYKPRKITAEDNFRVLGVVKGHLAVY